MKTNALKNYLPLLTILAVAMLGGLSLGIAESAPMKRLMELMMGLFLLQFSVLKLFNIPGFADGFQKYDLLAKAFRPYALIYPFLELLLALGYLASFGQPVYLATIILMSFGAIGVFKALAQGLDTRCACLGTSLNVPLSTVAVAENLTMVVMAAAMTLI